MGFLKKFGAELPLRLGLGAVYVYSGLDLMRHPTAWHWALPYWLRELISGLMPLDTYLRIQGGVEIVLAAIFLGWLFPKRMVCLAAFIAALEFITIFVLAFLPFSEANFLITFRDIGLLGGALSLLIMNLSSRSSGENLVRGDRPQFKNVSNIS